MQSRVERRIYHKTISQQSVQLEQNAGKDVDRLGADEELVSKGSRDWGKHRYGEFSAIDVGKGLNVEVHRGVYRHEREHSGP